MLIVAPMMACGLYCNEKQLVLLGSCAGSVLIFVSSPMYKKLQWVGALYADVRAGCSRSGLRLEVL